MRVKRRAIYRKDESLKSKRQKLRLGPTKAEYVLWQELRKEKVGYKFRRQVSILHFIVDFYCHEKRIIIEVDGPIHDEQKEYDKKRELILTNLGYKLIRFKNDEVLFERERVMEIIQSFCKGERPPPDLPL